MVLYHHFWSSSCTQNRHKPTSFRPSRILHFHPMCAATYTYRCVMVMPNDPVSCLSKGSFTGISDTKLMWIAPAGLFPGDSAFKLQYPTSFVTDTPRKVAPSARSLWPLILTEPTFWKSMAPTVSPCYFHFNLMHQNSQYLKKYQHAPNNTKTE